MENGTPSDTQQLLNRLGELEKKLTRLEAENTHLKSELARKDKIIAGLQQRLFGSSSEKLDPAQLQLKLDELLLGKPAPPLEPSGDTSAPEEEKPNAAKTRRTKADRFPKNLKILVEQITIPDEVLANPDDWQEIGEENHDELDVIKAVVIPEIARRPEAGAGVVDRLVESPVHRAEGIFSPRCHLPNIPVA